MPELFYPASTVIILDSPPVVFGSGVRRNDGFLIMFNLTEVELMMITLKRKGRMKLKLLQMVGSVLLLAGGAEIVVSAEMYELSDENNWCLESRLSAFRMDADNSGRNFTRFITAPLRMNSHSLAIAGALLGTTALAFVSDIPVRHEAQENHSAQLDAAILPWEMYGGGATPFAIAAISYIGGIGISNSWLRETGRECIISLTCATVVTTTLKIALGRERPFLNAGPMDFDPLAYRDENRSFPSGHTTAAFALSSVFAARVNSPLLAGLCYVPAFLTAAQRVYSDRHWTTDVLAGALVGTTTGLFVVNDSRPHEIGDSPALPTITPVFAGGGVGIGLNQCF